MKPTVVYGIYDSQEMLLKQHAALQTMLAKDAVKLFLNESFVTSWGKEDKAHFDAAIEETTTIEELTAVLAAYDFQLSVLTVPEL